MEVPNSPDKSQGPRENRVKQNKLNKIFITEAVPNEEHSRPLGI